MTVAFDAGKELSIPARPVQNATLTDSVERAGNSVGARVNILISSCCPSLVHPFLGSDSAS